MRSRDLRAVIGWPSSGTAFALPFRRGARHDSLTMPRLFSIFLAWISLLGIQPFEAEASEALWQVVVLPGSIPLPAIGTPSPWRAYRAWVKPHDSFFTPHERNLFAESVTLNIRGFSGAHEVFVNGVLVGRGGQFPPDYRDGVDGNHRHKISPGLLRQGQWNGIVLRAYHPEGQAGFRGEVPFLMDYFNEAILEGEWEWRTVEPSDVQSGLSQPQADRPARAAFDRYHESHRVLG